MSRLGADRAASKRPARSADAGQREQRETASSVAALAALFHPASVAVIGASRDSGTLGGRVFANLLRYGFEGPVYPVNPRASVVQSVVAYQSVLDVPGPVDLAVLVVPAQQAVRVAEECGRKGVRSLVAITAGFAETGPPGRDLQEKLVAVCRRGGMRLIGPNSMGIINTDPAVRLDATFAPELPREGRIAFSSQSGALGKAVIEHAGSLGLGISSFVSVGNKADISGNDLLRYWEQDERTSVILLYLESFGNPRKFSRIARRVGQRKPIVAVKSGRTRAGTRATSSHTGALLLASDVTVDALFRQAGVIRTDTLEEMFGVTSLLASQEPPRGRRVAILTNAGGPGILCTDACEAEGLEIPVLAEHTQAALRAFLPAAAAFTNPVDMIASATAEHYKQAIEIVGQDPSVDALIVIYIPPQAQGEELVARAIAAGASLVPRGKSLVSVFMAERSVTQELNSGSRRIPSFLFPESAAIALAHAARYGEWRAKPAAGPPALPGLRRKAAARIVEAAVQSGPSWMRPADVHELLACYGLPLIAETAVSSPEAAACAAAEIAGKVALKAVLAGPGHKTEKGGVRLNLSGVGEVLDAARQMEGLLRERDGSGLGFLVQPMAAPGVEMIVGVVHDPHFGPVVACGAGGTLVELWSDVRVRLSPLSAADAAEMIRELRSFPLLAGHRGAAPADVAALEDVLLRTSALVEDRPEIAELDMNPVLVHAKGATIVDARVRLSIPV